MSGNGDCIVAMLQDAIYCLDKRFKIYTQVSQILSSNYKYLEFGVHIS